MKKNSMNDQIDHRSPLLPSNFVQTVLTCVILYTCIMATVEFLIKVWRRMRFNQSKTACFKYGYSNTKKNDPKYWRELFACCDGANQSPINIDTCAATCVYACNPLTWSNFDNKPQNMIMLNTGSTVMLAGCWYWDKPLSISGGPLEQRSYSLKEVYFRWGRGEGSEHTIDSVRFPMEIQLRFINQTSGDNVFIALFCKISHQDNPNLVCLVNSLNEIILPGTSTEIPFSFDWLQLPFCHGYYTYPGSFTFPPCCENVTWIVKPQPINISHAQVKKFREVRNNHGRILTNSRPVQSLNSRTVMFYEDSSEADCNRN